MIYAADLRRNRENRTNYRKRAAMLLGRQCFVSITVSNQNVKAQVLKPSAQGDTVVSATSSKELVKFGWKGSMKSIPSSYLTGLVLGIKTLGEGITSLILYTGKGSFTTRVAACLKGMIDAGLRIPVSEVSLPNKERLTGSHVAQYAALLKQDGDRYRSQFSFLLKNGFLPENYPNYFEEVKSRIISFGTVVANNTANNTTTTPTTTPTPTTTATNTITNTHSTGTTDVTGFT
jgi:large subunit ribosomal protein L18